MQKKILYIFLISFFCFNLVLIQNVFADSDSNPIKNFSETAAVGFTGEDDGKLEDSGVVLDLSSGIGSLLGAALSLLGVIFLLLMIYGGFRWMLARGNEQEIEKAKNLIQAAVIGLMIVLSAYAITSLIGDSFANA